MFNRGFKPLGTAESALNDEIRLTVCWQAVDLIQYLQISVRNETILEIVSKHRENATKDTGAG